MDNDYFGEKLNPPRQPEGHQAHAASQDRSFRALQIGTADDEKEKQKILEEKVLMSFGGQVPTRRPRFQRRGTGYPGKIPGEELLRQRTGSEEDPSTGAAEEREETKSSQQTERETPHNMGRRGKKQNSETKLPMVGVIIKNAMVKQQNGIHINFLVKT